MKHKTSELTGALLDAAVAIAEGKTVLETEFGTCWVAGKTPYEASTSWVIAGPIIDRERIHLTPVDAGNTFNGVKQERDGWLARCTESFVNERGDTPLIAAMRAYVASKLGDEVDL